MLLRNKKLNSRFLPLMLTSALAQTILAGGFTTAPATAARPTAEAGEGLQCLVPPQKQLDLSNSATVSYTNSQTNQEAAINSNTLATNVSTIRPSLETTATGIKDEDDEVVITLGLIASAIENQLVEAGISQTEAKTLSITALETFVALPITETITSEGLEQIQAAILNSLPEQQSLVANFSDVNLLLALTGLTLNNLTSLGLAEAEAEAVVEAANGAVNGASLTTTLETALQTIYQASITAAGEQEEIISELEAELIEQKFLVRTGTESELEAGELLDFEFLLTNTQDTRAVLTIPTISSFEASSLSGPGKVKSLRYQVVGGDQEVSAGTVTDEPVELGVNPNEAVVLSVVVEMSEYDRSEAQELTVQVEDDPCSEDSGLIEQSVVLLPPLDFSLIDPLGQVTGCAGELLPDYRGFSVAMYDADADSPFADMTGLSELTVTELPDNPNNNIPKGLAPNTQNNNPFFLTNEDQGKYSFLFDADRGQLDLGRTYVLVVSPPEGIDYDERRIKIVIGERNGNIVRYTATSLDGRPISRTDDRTTISDVIAIDDAESVGLVLAILNIDSSVCQSDSLAITKSGDRATAAPGDIVLYRLTVRSLAASSLNEVEINDILPAGFRLQPEVVRGHIDGEEVEINTTQDQRDVTFSINRRLDQGDILNIIYAAEVTPDALRGEGINSAVVTAERLDNGDRVSDGPAVHEVDIDPGIVTDCGTLIGRVFEDHNFDGQQQSGEPGIPNAVIFLENGNRVTTDADGLFSVNCMLPGYHTGTLDLTAIPGYQLAPNLKFSEGNSHSRMVRLTPGGMARMNFAVTPSGDHNDEEVQENED